MSDGDKLLSRPSGPTAARVSSPMILCSECRTTVAAADLETHLRQQHRIYQFRGVRRSFNDTFVALLEALLGDPPDAEAWQTLRDIAVEDQGARSDVFLAITLGQILTRINDNRREKTLEALGELIGRGGATGLAGTLASDAELQARRLALSVIANLPAPIDAVLIPPLRGLLLDRRLPVDAQFAALAAVLPSIGVESPVAEELLQTLISGLGKARSIEQLRRFEEFIGKNAVLDSLCEQLEDRLRMNCPRCSAQLRRPAMIEHLWDEHRLILDARRVREPWSVIEEWIERYCQGREQEWLDRSRVLAQRLDTDDATRRFQRLLLSHGIADDEARRTLSEEAALQHASLCPWCFALVPVPSEVPPLQLNAYRGRLSSGGYRIEVFERTWRTSLEIATPSTLLYRGREPGQTWTRRGATYLFVGPLVLLALAWACGWIAPSSEPLVPVAVILGIALLAYGLVRWLWRPRLSAVDRARNYAWTRLVPRLFQDGYRIEDSAFLAGLAILSIGDGYEALRAPLLPDLAKRTESALGDGLVPPGHLSALRRLMVEDAIWRGAEPVPLLVDLLARCFEGRFSLQFAEHLLADWPGGWRTPGNMARLRVLLCDRAFEAGFEVRNLLDAGRTAPALGAVLGTANVTELSALRLLWTLRRTRPWDRCGEARTVFDLAADPQRSELLARYPDLLLWQEEPNWPAAYTDKEEPKPAQIVFCVRGVALQDVLFAEKPKVVELNSRRRYKDLILGDHRFRSTKKLDGLALRMERWFRYAFSEFLPELPRVEKWRTPDRLAILRAWGAVNCPECQRQSLPHVGEVGIALEEEEVGTK